MTWDLAAGLEYNICLHMTRDLGIILAMLLLNIHEMGVLRLPNEKGLPCFLTHDMGNFENELGTCTKNISKPFFSHVERCFEWFSRVGRRGFNGLGRPKMKHGEGFGLPMLRKDAVESV